MYSMGPSCGSESSLVIPYSESNPGRGRLPPPLVSGCGVVCFSDPAGDLHGEETRVGSTKENRDAIRPGAAVVESALRIRGSVRIGDDGYTRVSLARF